MKKRRWGRYLVVTLLVVLVAAVIGFVIWAQATNPVMDSAIAALASDSLMAVEQDEWIVFRPAAGAPTVGLVFYPGGKVDARAYAPLARAVAAQGYLVVIVPMPLNLAVLGSGRAGRVMDAHPEIEAWAVGGHSLGGAMAAGYAHSHRERVAGLVLYAGYPAQSASLAEADLPVLSIYGTRDGGLDGLQASPALLPPDTTYVVIEGGNHAQFGDYGPQAGDGEAAISRAAQQTQAARATVELLDRLAASVP